MPDILAHYGIINEKANKGTIIGTTLTRSIVDFLHRIAIIAG